MQLWQAASTTRSIWSSVITNGGQNVHVSVPIARVDHAGGEHRVADRHGVLVGTQASRPHRAGAADVIDRAVGGERLEAGGEALADRLGPGEQRLVIEHAEVGEPGGAGAA